MRKYIEQSIELNSIWQTSCQYPDVTTNNEGISFLVYQQSVNNNDSIVFQTVKEGALSPKKVISSKDSLSYRPSIHCFNDEIIIHGLSIEIINGILCIQLVRIINLEIL